MIQDTLPVSEDILDPTQLDVETRPLSSSRIRDLAATMAISRRDVSEAEREVRAAYETVRTHLDAEYQRKKEHLTQCAAQLAADMRTASEAASRAREEQSNEARQRAEEAKRSTEEQRLEAETRWERDRPTRERQALELERELAPQEKHEQALRELTQELEQSGSTPAFARWLLVLGVAASVTAGLAMALLLQPAVQRLLSGPLTGLALPIALMIGYGFTLAATAIVYLRTRRALQVRPDYGVPWLHRRTTVLLGIALLGIASLAVTAGGLVESATWFAAAMLLSFGGPVSMAHGVLYGELFRSLEKAALRTADLRRQIAAVRLECPSLPPPVLPALHAAPVAEATTEQELKDLQRQQRAQAAAPVRLETHYRRLLRELAANEQDSRIELWGAYEACCLGRPSQPEDRWGAAAKHRAGSMEGAATTPPDQGSRGVN